jgi:LPXTG-site transpeptidase (sortase) family protein
MLKSTYRLVGILLFGMILAECSPSSLSIERTILPAPRVRRESILEGTPTMNMLNEPGATPTVPPLPVSGSLDEMAHSAYGDRLIEWIRIPKISVYAPVVPVGWKVKSSNINGDTTIEWDSPNAKVGWVISSGLPGENNNAILYGHNNIDSSVFKRLGELSRGDLIVLSTGQGDWKYSVKDVEIISVVREEENQQAFETYFRTSDYPQLTLLSCWPPISNTHRVIVLAEPVLTTEK